MQRQLQTIVVAATKDADQLQLLTMSSVSTLTTCSIYQQSCRTLDIQ